LTSFFELASRGTFEAQLAFTHSVNTLNLMASASVLQKIDGIVTNYADGAGSEERQWSIVNELIYEMRIDLIRSDRKAFENYDFPFLVTDVPQAEATSKPPRRRVRRKS
jgi:hypothetical protein